VKLSRYLLIVWLAIAAGNVLGAEKKAMPPPEPSFQGDRAAVELAEGMFDAVGGKQAWAALRALYIKAEHTEPQIPAPYQSEIWRGIDEFELRIDQGNDSFHALARVNAQGGTVTYLDDRDSTRVLSTEELAQWKFEHDHNVYVVLHRLGKHPAAFRVALEETDRLTFYEDDQLLAAFRLDDQLRPHLFYQPTHDGGLAASEFSTWGTHDGLTHSAGGGPLDGNFHYTTLEWQPSDRSFSETYSFAEDSTPGES
jgi:hypothetical protein